MMKHSRWMPVLLAAGLAWSTAQRAAGETFNYEGDPDHPFPGAWGTPDVECAEWDSAEESECWKCEGGSPPEPVPKYGWALTTQAPSFEFEEPEEVNLCLEEGRGEVVPSSAPDYTVTPGNKTYTPTIAACGTESNIPINVISIEWTWAVVGCDTLQSGETGTGDSTYAAFVASPKNLAVSITYSYVAQTDDGGQLSGTVTGTQVNLEVYPPPEEQPKGDCDTVNYVYVQTVPDNSDGQRRNGYIKIGARPTLHLGTEKICPNAEPPLCRITGLLLPPPPPTATIATHCEVRGANCPVPAGTLVPRSTNDIRRTELHELHHWRIQCEFVNEWASMLEQGNPMSCEDAEIEKDRLQNTWLDELNLLRSGNADHTHSRWRGMPSGGGDACCNEITGQY